jgi:PPOX class probable F420-dependent enzyme
MSGFLPWNRVSHKLRNAESYWLCTSRPDGRPHAMPVWGLWDGETLWFGTGLESVKAHNLAANPHAVVHLESGEDVVVIEGEVERVTSPDVGEPVIERLAEKYETPVELLAFAGDLAGENGGALYALHASVAMAWLEGAFDHTQSRWRLPDDVN